MRLPHPPDHAQADFGEATVVICGIEHKARFFVLDLPHSDGCYVRSYPAAVAEAWVDGHVHAFAFFGAMPQSIVYDNDRCLVAKILPDGTCKRAGLLSGFPSYEQWARRVLGEHGSTQRTITKPRDNVAASTAEITAPSAVEPISLPSHKAAPAQDELALDGSSGSGDGRGRTFPRGAQDEADNRNSVSIIRSSRRNPTFRLAPNIIEAARKGLQQGDKL